MTRILIVEDDVDIRALLARGLEAEGFEVGTAACVDDALQAARDPAPGAVLLDIKMPMVNGIDVLRELKRHDDLAEIPVVMLTSSAEDGDLQTCYGLGANSFIVKPVEIELFFQAVLDIGRYWLILNRPPQEKRHGVDFAVADR